jgi:hypothetical protein
MGDVLRRVYGMSWERYLKKQQQKTEMSYKDKFE